MQSKIFLIVFLFLNSNFSNIPFLIIVRHSDAYKASTGCLILALIETDYLLYTIIYYIRFVLGGMPFLFFVYVM